MTHLLKFYGRQMWALPLFIVIGLIFAPISPSISKGVVFGLLGILIYNWNVTEKSEKTWRFFQALPINFFEKTIVKVAVPFVFTFLICAISSRTHFLKQIISGDFNDAVLIASSFVLASILAKGAVSFALWLLCLSMVHILPNNGPVAVIFAAIYLMIATIFLSEKRIAWKSATIKVAAACIPLTIALHYSRVPVLNIALRSKSPETRLIAADQLLFRKVEIQSKNAIADALLTSSDTPTLLKAVSILENHDTDVTIPKDRWMELLSSDSELRSEILSYFRHNLAPFPWLDVEFFQFVELDVITSNDRCKNDCRALARLAGELTKGGNPSIDDYIKARLSSVDTGKIVFGLHAAQFADTKKFQPEILKLLEHGSKDIRNEAEDLLQNMVGNTVELGDLSDLLNEIDSDLTEVEKKKLHKILDDIVLPSLKISTEVR
jgi:hypothetical protein